MVKTRVNSVTIVKWRKQEYVIIIEIVINSVTITALKN